MKIIRLFWGIDGLGLGALSAACPDDVNCRDCGEIHRFETFMEVVYELAPEIPRDDESWQEWFHLYYFQECESPEFAVRDTRNAGRW